MSTPADLMAAVQAGDRDRVASLLAAEPDLAAVRDANGVSAPLLARYHSHHELVALLLAARPSLDVFAAAGLGEVQRLRELLVADPALAAAFAGDGQTPLGLASFFVQPACVALLLERGADVEAASRNPMRVRPLHAAAAGHSLEIVRLLLAAGADPNVRQQAGFTPLQAAALHGDLEMVEVLLDAGADPALRSDDGKSAADLAREKGHAAVVTRLERA